MEINIKSIVFTEIKVSIIVIKQISVSEVQVIAF